MSTPRRPLRSLTSKLGLKRKSKGRTGRHHGRLRRESRKRARQSVRDARKRTGRKARAVLFAVLMR